MRSFLVGFLLAGSATAFAQAPGDVPLTPVNDTPVVCAAAPVLVPVLEDRWSVGMSVGGLGVTPKGGTTATRFGVAELAFRYRFGRHLELEVAGAAGGQTQPDGTPGNLEVRDGVVAARWHFRPEQPWSWYVSAGAGALNIAGKDATQQQRDDAMRPLGEVGIGVERRWRHFGLAAELTAIGVGAVKPSDAMAMPQMPAAKTMAPAGELGSNDTAGAAQVTLGASYYF